MEKLLNLLLDFELKKPIREEKPLKVFVHFKGKKGIGGIEFQQNKRYMNRMSEKDSVTFTSPLSLFKFTID